MHRFPLVCIEFHFEFLLLKRNLFILIGSAIGRIKLSRLYKTGFPLGFRKREFESFGESKIPPGSSPLCYKRDTVKNKKNKKIINKTDWYESKRIFNAPSDSLRGDVTRLEKLSCQKQCFPLFFGWKDHWMKSKGKRKQLIEFPSGVAVKTRKVKIRKSQRRISILSENRERKSTLAWILSTFTNRIMIRPPPSCIWRE